MIAYSSKSITGQKVAVTGSIAIPKGKKPKGGWPVVTYAHGTTGIARHLRAFAQHAERPG